MTEAAAIVFEWLCAALCVVFAWSSLVAAAGLLAPRRKPPKAARKLRFAILVCARNEEHVVARPVESILAADYPAEAREAIVLADNCTDGTAAAARAAGATVWEKTTPGSGKGDVLAWGVEKAVASGKFDAIAVFDADNTVSRGWLEAMNDTLCSGEEVATGRRFASNARHNAISGWYAVYWSVMNELSNKVRTRLGLSGKLTGTGFAFLVSALKDGKWQTRTLTEDVEFTVQCNLAGKRIGYVPEAEYADEQPIDARHMWRQLCRWATGCWQVARFYFAPWIKTMAKRPSLRLFDCFFAILTGMSVAFILLSDFLMFAFRLFSGDGAERPAAVFGGVLAFVCAAGIVTAAAACAMSAPSGDFGEIPAAKRFRTTILPVVSFPVFSLILSATVLWSLVRPTRRWRPIPHGDTAV